MSNKWLNYEKLIDNAVFDKIETIKSIKIPSELKNFITVHHCASPEKYIFLLNGKEEIFGAVLSFNENDNENSNVFDALENVQDNDLFPFAIDPFGNYLCYSLTTQEIVFWDIEMQQVVKTNKNLKNFIYCLT